MVSNLSNFKEYQMRDSSLKKVMGGASCTARCPEGGSISVSNVHECRTVWIDGEKVIDYLVESGEPGTNQWESKKCGGAER